MDCFVHQCPGAEVLGRIGGYRYVQDVQDRRNCEYSRELTEEMWPKFDGPSRSVWPIWHRSRSYHVYWFDIGGADLDLLCIEIMDRCFDLLPVSIRTKCVIDDLLVLRLVRVGNCDHIGDHFPG